MRYMTTYRNGNRGLKEFDQLFDEIFGKTAGGQTIPVDVRETKDGYLLEADVPGYKEEQIQVNIEDERLIISLKNAPEDRTEAEEEQEQARYLCKERRRGETSRTFVLPKDVDKDSISASYRQGVLTLSLAKKPEAQPKQIQITTE